MERLGTLEDLPKEYVEALTAKNLVPLWPSLRDVLPPYTPKPKTQAIAWKYQDIRPLLMQAGELTPIEKAERRVLVLANPGHTLENMCASSIMYLGMQLLLPGEWAPSHRHTPNAVRLIVEGNGAYTSVDGEKCEMERGDLILTPSGMWHEHSHDGDSEVVWLDVLDLPLVYYSETSYVEEGEKVKGHPDSHPKIYGPGIVATENFQRNDTIEYPILRYPWVDTKKSLESIAENKDVDMVQVTYVNPETGQDAQKIIGFSAIMLRPNEVLRLPRRSCAMIFHVIEGDIIVDVDDVRHELIDSDTSCAPCFANITLTNTKDTPAFVFVADESPFQKKLGLYSERPRTDV